MISVLARAGHLVSGDDRVVAANERVLRECERVAGETARLRVEDDRLRLHEAEAVDLHGQQRGDSSCEAAIKPSTQRSVGKRDLAGV